MPVSCRPVLPARAQLPWILGTVSVALLAYGVFNSSGTPLLTGGLGAVATFIGFVLPRLVLRPVESEEETTGSNNQTP